MTTENGAARTESVAAARDVGGWTPGPWHADSYGNVTAVGSIFASICEVPVRKWAASQAKAGKDGNQEAADWCGKCHDCAVADAHLIAAAPDLYAACERAAEYLEAGPDDNFEPSKEVLKALRLAIAKARKGGGE